MSEEEEFLWEEDDETPEAVVLGDWGWGGYHAPDFYKAKQFPENKIIPWSDELEKFMRQINWYSGYGAPECPAVYVWTRNFVYYVVQYDGSTGWEKIPRNPCHVEPEMPGG